MANQDRSSKKLFVSTPTRFVKTGSEIDMTLLDLNTSRVGANETMDLQLSFAEKQERYIIFEEEPRVLIIYCSGSFGCFRVGHGYSNAPGGLEKQLRSYTILCDKAHTEAKDSPEHWMYTPHSVFNKRVRYRVRELPNISPSSDISIESMLAIGKAIQEEYYNYESFIILHGSDTIAATSTVLSFMLENLRKTVLITACLIPLCEPRNDGNNNLVAALTIAGHYWIPEVAVLFNNRVYRGNRIIKDGATALDSIKSPNFGALVKIGSYFDIKWSSILYNKAKEPFNVSLSLEPNLSSFAIFPFMTAETFSSAFSEDVKGVIIETYGSGNFPSNRPELHEIIKKAVERGVIVVNVSQCRKGDVSDIYEGAVLLGRLGVINGMDMTMECAQAKLSYLLGKGYPIKTIKELLTKNLRGEITNAGEMQSFTVNSPDFVIQMSEMALGQLSIGKHKILPSLLTEAAALGQKETFTTLHTQGYNLDIVDYEGRTPLHIASIFDKIETAKQLIKIGLKVNALDSESNSPLYYAVKYRNYGMAMTLHGLGGKLLANEDTLRNLLMNTGYFGKLQRLKILDKCGVDLSMTDRTQRNLAHQAALNNSQETLAYVAQHRPELLAVKDSVGKLPGDYVAEQAVKITIKGSSN